MRVALLLVVVLLLTVPAVAAEPAEEDGACPFAGRQDDHPYVYVEPRCLPDLTAGVVLEQSSACAPIDIMTVHPYVRIRPECLPPPPAPVDDVVAFVLSLIP